jgi:hypothetical protein
MVSAGSRGAIVDIFRTSSAPYVLALIVTAIGWYFARLATEVESTRAASYYVEVNSEAKTATVHLTNVSRKEPLQNLEFSLVCRTPPCFTEKPPGGAQGLYAHLVAVPPVATSATTMVRLEGDEVRIRTTLPAGGSVDFVSYLAQPGAELLFFYLPDSKNPTYLYLYSGRTLFGWIIRNYLRVLIGGFLGFGTILMLWLLVALFKYVTQKPKEDGNELQRHHVILSFDFDRHNGGKPR